MIIQSGLKIDLIIKQNRGILVHMNCDDICVNWERDNYALSVFSNDFLSSFSETIPADAAYGTQWRGFPLFDFLQTPRSSGRRRDYAQRVRLAPELIQGLEPGDVQGIRDISPSCQ